MPDPSGVTTYLDHAATTPLRPEVAQAMADAQAEPLGNPTGSHRPAQRARRLLEESRDVVADFLGRPPRDIVFTSGGTESANLAVAGLLSEGINEGRAQSVVCSAIEHPAVLESCRAAARSGVEVIELPVDVAGVVQLNALEKAMEQRPIFVAVMTANNETGVVQPLSEVGELVRAANDSTCVFTDAVQATPFLDLAQLASSADLLALSAHKAGGPVGMGVLAVSPRAILRPLHYGGGQEQDRRSGTQNVVGAVGLATALRLAHQEREAAARQVADLRDRLADGLLDTIVGAHRTVPTGIPVLPGHLHLCLPEIEREELLVALGQRGICASGGSSCASGALQPSHVLSAMGIDEGLSEGAIRFTLGRSTTQADIDRALAIVPEVVGQLRHRS
ncbi:MAG TPA: cysteine desulfurase family protein [Acidimicrobiales bacterium]